MSSPKKTYRVYCDDAVHKVVSADFIHTAVAGGCRRARRERLEA